MGGEIDLESTSGSGSTFWFTAVFENTSEEEGRQASVAPTGAALATKPAPVAEQTTITGNILIAEDNYINQQVTISLLEKLGCQFEVVTDGKAAVAAACSSDRYDLILMDCLMPNMDGYESTRAIREHEKKSRDNRHIPIIALTANAMEGARDTCLAAGMTDYLSKPFTSEQLQQMLQKWLLPPQGAAND